MIQAGLFGSIIHHHGSSSGPLMQAAVIQRQLWVGAEGRLRCEWSAETDVVEKARGCFSAKRRDLKILLAGISHHNLNPSRREEGQREAENGNGKWQKGRGKIANWSLRRLRTADYGRQLFIRTSEIVPGADGNRYTPSPIETLSISTSCARPPTSSVGVGGISWLTCRMRPRGGEGSRAARCKLLGKPLGVVSTRDAFTPLPLSSSF